MKEQDRCALAALVIGNMAVEDFDGCLAERLFGHRLQNPLISATLPRDSWNSKSVPLAFAITDLRQRPEFFDPVADRI
jgi:hypothetical protein